MDLKYIKSGGFFNLPEDYSGLNESKVVIVPFGLEKTTSYGKGTSKGPEAVLRASHQVELFDEDTNSEIYKSVGGIASLEAIKVEQDHKEALSQLENVISNLLDKDKFPVVIGGEHSLTVAPIRALKRIYGGKLSVLHFDAHADLRSEYEGNKLSHASSMYLLLSNVKQIVSVGIRNISADEQFVLGENTGKIKIYLWRKDLYPVRGKLRTIGKEIVSLLKDNAVYVTFDVDVFDPAIISSSTGTPEPGGLMYDETLDILSAVLPFVNVVGADIVEHSPVSGMHAPDFMVAKLLYKLLGYSVRP